MRSTCSLAASIFGAPWTEAKAGRVSFTGKVLRPPIEPTQTNTTFFGWTTATWWCPTTEVCSGGTNQGYPICLRDCKSPKRMRSTCTQHNQVSLCWALKTTARPSKLRCTKPVCWTETGSIAFSAGTPRTPCTPLPTTDCCTDRSMGDGPWLRSPTISVEPVPSTKWGRGTRRFNLTRPFLDALWSPKNRCTTQTTEAKLGHLGQGQVRSAAPRWRYPRPTQRSHSSPKTTHFTPDKGQKGSSRLKGSLVCTSETCPTPKMPPTKNGGWLLRGTKRAPKCGEPSTAAPRGTM